MTDPSTTPHPSLNAIDPHTGGLAAIWTIRCCPACEPGLIADGAVSEPCREHGGDPRISPTSSGQQSIHPSHEPFHSEILAHATSASQEGLNTDPGRYPEDAP